MTQMPETRYATTADDVSIAYQIVGAGEPDIVFVNSAFTSNVELLWEWPMTKGLIVALAVRGRVLLFDRRGTGLSDSVSGDRLPTLEARVEDIRTVMDAAGVDRVVLYGLEDGAAQSFLFAATYPERTRGIVCLGAASRGLWAPEAPWLWTEQQWDEEIASIEAGWGTSGFTQVFTESVMPQQARDPAFVRGFGRLMRHALSRGDAVANERMFRDIDVRRVLPLIQSPTLVQHFADDQVESVEEGRYIATHIPGATFVELPGTDHAMLGDLVALDHFLDSLREDEEVFDRVLATVLFTDIVGSTARSAELGDRAWGELLHRHHAAVRALLGRFRGTEVDTAGDGFFATFDGPARAVRCARAIIEAVRALGLEVRAGIHTGEVTNRGPDVHGIAVHIGARVGALAGPSEVLVSQTVKDLVAGSGLAFEDAGEHDLKGVPDRWRLYRVTD
ncbi:MAG: alpha/beta fold hydrolase [Actinomycetota bacterium]